MNNLTHKATFVIGAWIKNHNLTEAFKQTNSVEEFKKLFHAKNFPISAGVKEENYIKGLKLVNWDALYQLVKNA